VPIVNATEDSQVFWGIVAAFGEWADMVDLQLIFRAVFLLRQWIHMLASVLGFCKDETSYTRSNGFPLRFRYCPEALRWGFCGI